MWLLGMCYRKLEPPNECTELGTDVAAFQSQSDVSGFIQKKKLSDKPLQKILDFMQ